MRARLSLSLLIATCGSLHSLANASDRYATVPSGWAVCPYVFAGSAKNVAVILYPTTSDPFLSTSQIMLVRLGGGTTLTELPGKAFAIAYSPGGAHVLVHHAGRDGPKVSLLAGTTGALIWTKTNEPRLFAFSGSGDVLVARRVNSEWPASGAAVEVFDLTGASLGRVSVDIPVIGVAVATTDSKVVLALDRIIVAYDFSQVPMVQLWSLNLDEADERVRDHTNLNADRFIAAEDLGKFKALRWDGTVEYAFDPDALAALDPARSPVAHASFRPYATPFANKLLPFDGSRDALLLDVATGQFAGKTLNVALPQGFKAIPGLAGGQFVGVADGQVLIRTIGL